MTIDQLTAFFGWCSAINLGVLILSSIALILLKRPVSAIHSRMTGIPVAGLPGLYFQYLGFYKIGIFLFNLVPYIALKLMA